jgi:hypothetical protein
MYIIEQQRKKARELSRRAARIILNLEVVSYLARPAQQD